MRSTNLGLIGIGGIGKVHLQSCLKLQNARLIAVADVSKQALKRASELGVQNVYSDYHELLEKSDVDAVIIALPTHLHAESAKAAAENNKHILLEKPLARSTSEGKEILNATCRYNVKLAISYPLRFFSPCQKLRAKIESGQLGAIQIAYATNVGTGPFAHRAEMGAPVPVPEWWWKRDLTGGGALMDLGCHMINLTRWLFGDVVEVKGYLGYRLNMEQEDHAVCLLKFDHGVVGVISVGWFSQQFQFELEVFGTAGAATTAQKAPSKMRTAMQLLLRKPLGINDLVLKETQNFIEYIQKDEKPETSGADALADLEVIERAYANRIRLS
jgi:predicted dehydrogenase